MEEDAFAWNLPPQTLQSWEWLLGASPSPRGRGRPPFGRGRERGSVRSLHNHHLGNTWHGENGWHYATLYVLPQGGVLKALCSFGLQPFTWVQECSFSLWSCPGDSPRLPGWHMLVSEERTQGQVSGQGGESDSLAFSSSSTGSSSVN